MGAYINPTPHARGWCIACGYELIARCGSHRVKHWAHKPYSSCIAIQEDETDWKREWRQLFKPDFCEVVRDGVFFDAICNNDTPVMLRVTAIDTDKLVSLQEKFPKMICIFDAQKIWGNLKMVNRGDHHTFRWYSPQKKLAYVRKLFFTSHVADYLK